MAIEQNANGTRDGMYCAVNEMVGTYATECDTALNFDEWKELLDHTVVKHRGGGWAVRRRVITNLLNKLFKFMSDNKSFSDSLPEMNVFIPFKCVYGNAIESVIFVARNGFKFRDNGSVTGITHHGSYVHHRGFKRASNEHSMYRYTVHDSPNFKARDPSATDSVYFSTDNEFCFVVRQFYWYSFDDCSVLHRPVRDHTILEDDGVRLIPVNPRYLKNPPSSDDDELSSEFDEMLDELDKEFSCSPITSTVNSRKRGVEVMNVSDDDAVSSREKRARTCNSDDRRTNDGSDSPPLAPISVLYDSDSDVGNTNDYTSSSDEDDDIFDNQTPASATVTDTVEHEDTSSMRGGGGGGIVDLSDLTLFHVFYGGKWLPMHVHNALIRPLAARGVLNPGLVQHFNCAAGHEDVAYINNRYMGVIRHGERLYVSPKMFVQIARSGLLGQSLANWMVPPSALSNDDTHQ